LYDQIKIGVAVHISSLPLSYNAAHYKVTHVYKRKRVAE